MDITRISGKSNVRRAWNSAIMTVLAASAALGQGTTPTFPTRTTSGADGVSAGALEPPTKVRITTVDSSGQRRWTGYVQRLTRDSIELRVVSGAPDRVVTLPRSAIRLTERQTPAVSRQRAALVGCAMGGGVLGTVGFSGPDQSGDFSGMKKVNGVLGIILGCPVGAVVAVLVSRGQKWESFLLPD